jgi:hypothetical protein
MEEYNIRASDRCVERFLLKKRQLWLSMSARNVRDVPKLLTGVASAGASIHHITNGSPFMWFGLKWLDQKFSKVHEFLRRLFVWIRLDMVLTCHSLLQCHSSTLLYFI